MAGVERLVAERRDAEALRLLGEAVAILPDHPLVLHERARRLSLAGDPAAALAILQRVVSLAPKHLPFRLSQAAVLRAMGRREEELTVLEQALTVEPRHLVALLQKGALLDLMQKPRAAAVVYGRALQALGPGTRLPAPIEAHVAHARKRVADNAARWPPGWTRACGPLGVPARAARRASASIVASTGCWAATASTRLSRRPCSFRFW